jgi:hypothetical protein
MPSIGPMTREVVSGPTVTVEDSQLFLLRPAG